ncbi:MAG TPA: ATP-binding protein [Anaerolineae bacterium]
MNRSLLSPRWLNNRDQLEKIVTGQHYAPGDVIFQEGEQSDDCAYVICSGRVVAFKGDAQSPMVLGYRGAGEIIGEMALLDGEPRSATVVAIEDLDLLKIGREDFHRLLQDTSDIGRDIMMTLTLRLRSAEDIRSLDLETGRQLALRVDELKAQKEHLEQLDQLRRETSDLIVHDLRNPLHLIGGALGLLKMVLSDDMLRANRELFDMADVAYGRIQRLIEALLDVAKMEAGQAQLQLEPTHLPPLISEIIAQELVAAEKRRRIAIHATLPPGLPLLMIDPHKIERVLINLLDNAISFTPEDGLIAVEVAAEPDRIRVSVADSGPGIPPEDRVRIFERFAQVPRKALRRGFGLGLTFCRLTIEAHGGRIWVEPGEGDIGSRFIFTLPRSSPSAADSVSA